MLALRPIVLTVLALQSFSGWAEECGNFLTSIYLEKSTALAQQEDPESEARDFSWIKEAFLSSLIEETRQIHAGSVAKDTTLTDIHRYSLEFMSHRLGRTLELGGRNVFDGWRKELPFIARWTSLNTHSRQIIEGLRNDISQMLVESRIDRVRFGTASLLFSAVFSSIRRYARQQDWDFSKYPKFEQRLFNANLLLEEWIESSPEVRNYADLVKRFRAQSQIAFYVNDEKLLTTPTAFPLTRYDLLRIWGRGIRLLGVSNQVQYGDGSQFGYSPLDFLRHDNSHSFQAIKQIERDGGVELGVALSEELERRFGSLSSLAHNTTGDVSNDEIDLTILFDLWHESAIAARDLKTWAREDGVMNSEETPSFITSDPEKFTRKIYDRRGVRDYNLIFSDEKLGFRRIHQRVVAVKAYLLGLEFLP